MTEDLTGVETHLGAAATAPDMLPRFGLAEWAVSARSRGSG